MATESFLESVVLTKPDEIAKFQQILSSESPRKDIKPISPIEYEQMKNNGAAWKTLIQSR